MLCMYMGGVEICWISVEREGDWLKNFQASLEREGDCLEFLTIHGQCIGGALFFILHECMEIV